MMPKKQNWLIFNSVLQIFLRGSTLQKSVKFTILFFLQKKGIYMLIDPFSKYHGANPTVNTLKTGPKWEKTRNFITFSNDLLLL